MTSSRHEQDAAELKQEAAELISRIAPDEGAAWVKRNDKGLAIQWGPLRDDWQDICQQAADYFMVQRKLMGIEDALKEALVFREQLLSNNGDKNDG